jgi:hypothetical protein
MTEITVVLVGGPERLPENERIRRVPGDVDTIKVCFGAGHEHFCYHGERTTVGEEELPAFEWIRRTAIAE